MSRVLFVMEVKVDDGASAFRVPTAENLREKMERVLHEYTANPHTDAAWVKRCEILRVIHIKNDGSKTAV